MDIIANPRRAAGIQGSSEFIPASIVAIDPVASLGYLAGASGFTVAGHSLGTTWR